MQPQPRSCEPSMRITNRVHKKQRLRHVVANKLMLPLTVLREIQDGRLVGTRLLSQASRDLKAIEKFVERTEPRDAQHH